MAFKTMKLVEFPRAVSADNEEKTMKDLFLSHPNIGLRCKIE